MCNGDTFKCINCVIDDVDGVKVSAEARQRAVARGWRCAEARRGRRIRFQRRGWSTRTAVTCISISSRQYTP